MQLSSTYRQNMQIQWKRRLISADVLFDGHDIHENGKLMERTILPSPVEQDLRELWDDDDRTDDVEDVITALKALEINTQDYTSPI